jgi:hypothetical protein
MTAVSLRHGPVSHDQSVIFVLRLLNTIDAPFCTRYFQKVLINVVVLHFQAVFVLFFLRNRKINAYVISRLHIM